VSVASSKARLAGLIAHRDPADPDIQAARGQLRYAVAKARIRELVDAAPPFTASQRAQLAVLLLAPDGPGDG
jgi:hypothetical protein